MNETYRMLGRERELDLEREARTRRLAATLPAKRERGQGDSEPTSPHRMRLRPRLLTAWLAR